MNRLKKSLWTLCFGWCCLSPVMASELVLNNRGEPESLDPHKVSGVLEGNVVRQMLEGLVTIDEKGQVAPGMAQSWETVDQKLWVFHLRHQAKWSNGDSVTAQDFVYSFRRLVDPNTAAPYASYLADAQVINAQDIILGHKKPDTLGVRAIDNDTLEIRLEKPVPYLPDMLTHTVALPVNQKAVEQYGDRWTQPGHYVANGAYVLKYWGVNDRIDLERNKIYWRDSQTSINTVSFVPIVDATVAVRRFEAGDIDYHETIPSDVFNRLKDQYPNQLHVYPKLCTYLYYFNTEKGPFTDRNLRRAISLVTDRELVVDRLLGQGQQPAYTLTPQVTNGIGTIEVDFQKWSKEKRLEKAKALFAQAGYGPEHPLKINLLYNTSDSDKKLASAMSGMLKQAFGAKSIEVELNHQEWKTYLESQRNGQFDLSRRGWCAAYNEPSAFLNTLKTGNSNNYSRYTSDKYDALLDRSLEPGVTAEQRTQYYRDAELLLAQDAPFVPVYYYVNAVLLNKKVQGWYLNDPQTTFYVRTLKIK